jgi:hypothetical protein
MASPRVRIRPACEGDVAWLLEQLAIFAKAYPGHHSLWPYDDPEYAETFLRIILENHVCFIAHIAGKPAGFIAGTLSPHPFNPKLRTLIALAWWVEVGSRNTAAGAHLLDRFMEYGKERADWIVANTITGFTDVRAVTFQKRGFHLHEQSYLYEVIPDEKRKMRSA